MELIVSSRCTKRTEVKHLVPGSGLFATCAQNSISGIWAKPIIIIIIIISTHKFRARWLLSLSTAHPATGLGAIGTEGGQAGWDLCPLWFCTEQSLFPVPAFTEKKSSLWWARGRHHLRRYFSKIPTGTYLAISQFWMWPRLVAYHSLSLATQLGFFFPDMARPKKSCLSSKEWELVRSFLVYLQRKQSVRLQSSLGGWRPCTAKDAALPCTFLGATSTCETLP